MNNLKFVFTALFIANSLFALSDVKTSNNKDNIILKKYEKVENIEPSEEEIFNKDSKETVKYLLSFKKIPNSFLSKNSIRTYYKKFDHQLIWSDKNGIKDISLILLETIILMIEIML